MNKKSEAIHLYRGCAAARDWSAYKELDKAWALCGLKPRPGTLKGTENPEEATCKYCLLLLRTARERMAAKANQGPTPRR